MELEGVCSPGRCRHLLQGRVLWSSSSLALTSSESSQDWAWVCLLCFTVSCDTIADLLYKDDVLYVSVLQSTSRSQ